MITITNGEVHWTPTPCSAQDCLVKSLDHGWFWGPNGEDFCKFHAKEAILKLRQAANPQASPSLNKPVNPFVNTKRLSGVLIRYAALPHHPIPSIWTPTRIYPYPNHRRKFGLKGSYPVAEGTVVNWGKHGDPNDRPKSTEGVQ